MKRTTCVLTILLCITGCNNGTSPSVNVFPVHKGHADKQQSNSIVTGNNLSQPTVSNAAANNYSFTEAFPFVSDFDTPLLITNDGVNDALYVVQRDGEIWQLSNDKNTKKKNLFAKLPVYESGEGGLLGLAFSPAFSTNGKFYAFYTLKNPYRTVVSQFQVTPETSNRDIIKSKIDILSLDQPYRNHNGGALSFGPDGYLYIGFGDGGSRHDPLNSGQSMHTYLGKILRVDVANNKLDIPPSNPFVATEGYTAAIWATGLRNPWRMSFDRATGELWVGDVGQNAWEEINIVKKGDNLGWKLCEGSKLRNSDDLCDHKVYTLPIIEYANNSTASVTGGFVYRGKKYAALLGHYFYADFMQDEIWAYNTNKPNNTPKLINTDITTAGFGEDLHGELLVTGYNTGRIYRLTIQSNSDTP